MVRRFPALAFHQQTQRLAVGTLDHVIIIYDLRTATKWRILEGHASAVSALAFSPSGDHLASYAAEEACVRAWSTSAGFLGGILGLHGRCMKVVSLPPSPQAGNTMAAFQNCSMEWGSSERAVVLVREDKCRCSLTLL